MKKVSFRRNDAVFSRAGSRSIHMLHYNVMGIVTEDGRLSISSDRVKGPVNSAELVISFEEGFSQATGEVDKMILYRKLAPRHISHSEADKGSGASDFC